MSTYTQILYHIVFATKGRAPVLAEVRREDLFRYMNGVIKNSHCRPIWTNGVKDHIHSLLSLHPTVALANLLKDIKVALGRLSSAQGARRHAGPTAYCLLLTRDGEHAQTCNRR
jgi:REP element-mobilizing transposase RayT